MRDKDGVNACMLIAEAASWYKKKYNKTLADAIDILYEKYGYYGDKVASFELPGKDGLEKMKHTMDVVAKYYDSELEQAVAKAIAMLEPALLIFIAVIAGFIVIAIYMAMFTMYQGM